jgi:hypothetical protein
LDGDLLGEADGVDVGCSEGLPEGALVGRDDGNDDGVLLGLCDGTEENEGIDEGKKEGALLGMKLGCALELGLKELVGEADGIWLEGAPEGRNDRDGIFDAVVLGSEEGLSDRRSDGEKEGSDSGGLIEKKGNVPCKILSVGSLARSAACRDLIRSSSQSI